MKKNLESIKMEIEKLTLLMEKNMDIDEQEIQKISKALDQLLNQYKVYNG